jgi:hypothetical protein
MESDSIPMRGGECREIALELAAVEMREMESGDWSLIPQSPTTVF